MFYVSFQFYEKITVADVQLYGLLAQTTQFRTGSSEGVVTAGLWLSFRFLKGAVAMQSSFSGGESLSSEGGSAFLQNLKSLCYEAPTVYGLLKPSHSISVCLRPSKHHRIVGITHPTGRAACVAACTCWGRMRMINPLRHPSIAKHLDTFVGSLPGKCLALELHLL